jgi:hypothetical protein
MGDWLSGIPLFWGKIIAVVGFLGMVIWAWFRPRSFIYQDAPDTNLWRDLRIWATVLMGIQIVLYLVF